MSLKRLLLTALTLLAIMLSGLSLFASWQKPQFQSRLELYQTNIVLQAQAWQPEDSNDESFQALRAAIVGDKPLESAAKQYLEARESVKTNLDKTKNQLDKLRAQDITAVTPAKPLPNEPLETKTSPQQQQKELEKSISKLQKLRDELDLRLGILQAQQGETDKAQKTWSQVQEPSETEFTATANVLSGLWSNPPRLLPNAKPMIQKNIEGWFRSTA